MCGIAGVYGKKAHIKTMLLTLSQLERGTLGCGIAWIKRTKIKYYKRPTHPVTVFRDIIEKLHIDTHVAISHNRLPSVGDVSLQNTHPFIACDRTFALIHNGTAFNHGLRIQLLREGHRIRGTTDSELLCHYLEDLLLTHGSFEDALLELAETKLNGAILVLAWDGTIYGIRTFSNPIHYLELDGEVYIASTEEAIMTVTENEEDIQPLKAYQLLKVKNGKVELIGEGKEEPKITYKYSVCSGYDWWRLKDWWKNL